ncbi:MAG: hypothetical protein ACXWOV_02830 [Isosphaeraceae bacterium]
MGKNYRLEGWFQVLNDGDYVGLDDLEQQIKSRLRSVGIVFQGGPVVYQLNMPRNGG